MADWGSWQTAFEEGGGLLTIELKNTKPVDLVDLTTSLQALAQEFQDFTDRQAGGRASEMKLFVRELRSGSIIADLVPMLNQVDWVLDHKDVVGGFVTNLQDVARFFLTGDSTYRTEQPRVQQAIRLAKILEPVAKDGSSQFNIQASDSAKVEVHNHFHVASIDANAIQNGIRRFLGPDLPALEMFQDRLMTLEQVKNDAAAKTGDKGIIESISKRAVKLQFLSEQAKQQVLLLQENPFQCIFLVDVEVHSVEGRPALYRIIAVKDVIEKDQRSSD